MRGEIEEVKNYSKEFRHYKEIASLHIQFKINIYSQKIDL
jgi:hypothetical protein